MMGLLFGVYQLIFLIILIYFLEYRKKCPIFRRREASEYREYKSSPIWAKGMG